MNLTAPLQQTLPTLQRYADQLKEYLERRRLERRETLLIVEPDGYWYASLPAPELDRLNWQGRYTGVDRLPRWIGAGIGTVVGVLLMGLWLQWMLGWIEFSFIVGLMFGGPPGFISGWLVGLFRFSDKALWVMRRRPATTGAKNEDIPGSLEAVVPRELLQHYNSDDTPFVIRADSLNGIRQQSAMRRLFRRTDKGLEKMQVFAMVVLILAFGAMLFLAFAMNQNTPAAGG